MENIKKELVKIANKHIPSLANRENLEQMFSDELDFFEVAVWCLESALIEAYELGKAESNRR